MTNLGNLSKLRRAHSRQRRKRGEAGMNYSAAMLVVNPEVARRIGLTARSKTSPTLFDQPPQQGSGGD